VIMAQPVTFKPSRTFALAAFGLLVLTLIAVGLAAGLVWALHAEAPPADLAGRLVSALQVVAGCVATVATAGAGSMAARDWSSRGLTSSQGYQVLAARGLPEAPPQAARAAPAPATAVPEADDGGMGGP